jgi:hypothetical protein
MRSPYLPPLAVLMTIFVTGCGSPTSPAGTGSPPSAYGGSAPGPGEPSGILSGTYHGSAGYVLGTCNGIPYDRLDLSLQQSGERLTGLWAMSGFCGGLMSEGGLVDGTFDPTPNSDGVGTVSVNLADSPDFGGFFIQGIVTTADGSKLTGKLVSCDPARCSNSKTLSETVSLSR